MPEGPEIRRAADGLAAVLEGRTIESIRFSLPGLRRHTTTLRGHTVTGIETHGKALLTHFEHDWSIYSHNQLYGVWRVTPRGQKPRTNRSLRLALHTNEHSALLYSASDISVWRTHDLDRHPFLSRIGPDILDPRLTWRNIAERLEDSSFRRRQLTSLFLDQRFLAGIGNYLRSEIMFDAGVNPRSRPADLTRGQRGQLARSTLSISRRSYMTAGITNPPGLTRSLRGKGLSFEQLRFAVFGRAGLPCHLCGEEVLREQADSRGLFWCPHCQG